MNGSTTREEPVDRADNTSFYPVRAPCTHDEVGSGRNRGRGVEIIPDSGQEP